MPNSNKRPLKIGLVMPVADQWMAGETARWSDMKAMALHAEAVGFDSIWVNDHVIVQFGGPAEPRHGNWECWSLLSSLAAVTSRVELGTAVVCTGFRNPALLAKMADAVDDISGGRLILGVGAGNHEPDHTAYGFPFGHRVSRFEEAIKIIHALLRKGEIDFQGQYYQVRDCELLPRLSPRNGPPIMIPARQNQPRMLRLMAEYAEYWTMFTVNSVENVIPFREAVDAACVKASRDPATLARTVITAVNLPGFEKTAPLNWARRVFHTETNKPVSGTPDDIADTLRALARAGLSHVPVWLEPNTMAGIDAFAPVLELLDRRD